MAATRTPAKFYSPLAIGAPEPYRALPVRIERMIHFVPPHNEKIRAKIKDIAGQVDVILGNLEDAIPADQKEAARKGFIAMASANDFGSTGLWTRINCLNRPGCWTTSARSSPPSATSSTSSCCRKWRGRGTSTISISSSPSSRPSTRSRKPILIHAILETAEGVNNVEAIAAASPRMHGMSLGPADLAASRGMKTTRVGGGHPDYGVLADAGGESASKRPFFQQDLWHYTVGKMVDACLAYGLKPFYGPFGDFSDPAACEAQFRNAFLQGCLGAWSLHPTQIDIAKRVFSPDEKEVAFAKRIIEAMPDGTGAVMIDGKMQDDATWKQAKVIVDLARLVAAKDPQRGAAYGLT